MKFKTAAVAAIVAALSLSACGGGRGTEPAPGSTGSDAPAAGFAADATIGVALPWLGTQNWKEAQTMFEAELKAVLEEGARACVMPLMNTASQVGFGAVIAALPGFLVLSKALAAIPNPLLNEAISVTVLAGITGSASGGLTIALDALGPTFMAIAYETGLSPELMHRVAVIGAGTLDSLPHNGAVVTLLAVCGCTHRDSYGDIAVTAVLGSIVALVVVIVLGTMFGSF